MSRRNRRVFRGSNDPSGAKWPNPATFNKGDAAYRRNTPRMKSILTALLLLGLTTAGLHATDKLASSYPLTTCIVSGEGLNDMGAPIDFIYKQDGKPDRLVKFCCKQCIGKFKKDPAKYLSKLDAAEAAAAAKK